MNKDTLIHGAKVFGYVAVSGAATALLAFLVNVHPSNVTMVAILGVINAVLAMVVKGTQQPSS